MIRQRNLSGSPAEAAAIVSLLESHPQVKRAHTLLLYSALPDEPSLQPLLDRLVEEGKTVLLPRVVNGTDMELCYYTGAADLQQGAFNIMEPIGKPCTDYESVDVAIVPGMAFDKQGHRLGRGKGYYDRLLPQLKKTYKIGVCYPSRLLADVPTDEHDVRMDEVVSAED